MTNSFRSVNTRRCFALGALIGLFQGSFLVGEARAQYRLSKPSIEWLASTLPTSSKVDVSRVVRTDSLGRRSWTTTGACLISGTRLVTGKKTGACTVILRVGSTSRYAASTSRVVLQVRRRTELNVHVASSLTKVFEGLGTAFTARFLNASVKFNFGGSATLVRQIQQGAPADVVVTADTDNIDDLVTSGDVRRTAIIDLASNKLAILVPRGNPDKIKSLADLSRSDLRVVLCDSSQPCGKYAALMLSRAKVVVDPASRESNASGVVARVATGEADAGISYVTDGLAAREKIDTVSIPTPPNVVAIYPLATVSTPSSRDPVTIAAFVAMARGTIGDRLLIDAGFGLP